MQLFERFRADYARLDIKGKLGIITPYKAQLFRLRQRFSDRYGDSITEAIEFNTTDAFQGRECEIIIFSCVRASPTGGIGFMTDIRRMNVGLTRAKSSLWILGDSRALVQGEFWAKLIEDSRRRDRYTTGNILAMLKKPGAQLPAPASPLPSPEPYEKDKDVEMTDALPMGEDGISSSSSAGLTNHPQSRATNPAIMPQAAAPPPPPASYHGPSIGALNERGKPSLPSREALPRRSSELRYHHHEMEIP